MNERESRPLGGIPSAGGLPVYELVDGLFFYEQMLHEERCEKNGTGAFLIAYQILYKEESPLIGQARRFFLEALGGVLGALGFGGA